jgi:hypothetical protein
MGRLQWQAPDDPYDFFASLSVGAGVTATVVSFRVPGDCQGGIIDLFGHGIDDVLAWPTTTFRIRRQGVPFRFYESIQDQLGEFRDPQAIGPLEILAGDTIDVQVTNADAVAHLYAARLRGYFRYRRGR